MDRQTLSKIADRVVKIYFDNNISVNEAIKKAKEATIDESDSNRNRRC